MILKTFLKKLDSVNSNFCKKPNEPIKYVEVQNIAESIVLKQRIDWFLFVVYLVLLIIYLTNTIIVGAFKLSEHDIIENIIENENIFEGKSKEIKDDNDDYDLYLIFKRNKEYFQSVRTIIKQFFIAFIILVCTYSYKFDYTNIFKDKCISNKILIGFLSISLIILLPVLYFKFQEYWKKANERLNFVIENKDNFKDKLGLVLLSVLTNFLRMFDEIISNITKKETRPITFYVVVVYAIFGILLNFSTNLLKKKEDIDFYFGFIFNLKIFYLLIKIMIIEFLDNCIKKVESKSEKYKISVNKDGTPTITNISIKKSSDYGNTFNNFIFNTAYLKLKNQNFDQLATDILE